MQTLHLRYKKGYTFLSPSNPSVTHLGYHLLDPRIPGWWKLPIRVTRLDLRFATMSVERTSDSHSPMPAHDQAKMRGPGEAAKRGDVESHYRAYRDYVWSLCAHWIGDRAEAEDLTQEVFIKALASPPRSCTSFWLYKVARSVSIDHVRRQARQQVIPVEELEGFLSPVAADFDGEDIGEVRRALVRALARLTKRDRQIALLRLRDQMSYSMIARSLRTTPHSARSAVWRARRAVSTELDGARSWGRSTNGGGVRSRSDDAVASYTTLTGAAEESHGHGAQVPTQPGLRLL